MNIVICAVAIFQSLHGYGSEAFTVSSKYGSTIRSRSSFDRSNRQMRHFAKPKKSMDDIRREIEEMGGDPSFLTDDDLIEADFQDDDDGDDAFLMPSMSLMAGMEGMSDVLSAKIGGDDQNDNKDKDIVPNVKDMKSYAGSNRLTGNVADSTRSTDDIRREIEEMGGDPAFLADDDMEGADIKSGDAKEEVAVAEKRVFLWDGEVIENAYFDE